jgi:hypothetical protein
VLRKYSGGKNRYSLNEKTGDFLNKCCRIETVESYVVQDMRFEKLPVTEYNISLRYNYLVLGNFLSK